MRAISYSASLSINTSRLTALISGWLLTILPPYLTSCESSLNEYGPSTLVAVVLSLQLLARLETNRLAGRNGDFFPGARITPDTAFAWFDDKDAKAAQLDAITTC